MKTNTRTLLLVMAVSALVCGQVFSQPNTQQPNLRIDPLTGMPTGAGSNVSSSFAGNINPDTGLPAEEIRRNQAERERLSSPSPLPGDSQLNSGGDLTLLLQAQTLSANGQYDRALQCFLELDAQAQASTNSVLLKTALPDWVKLGEKHPKAKQALVDIRDRDTREFSQGRGELQLLQEVADVNEALGDDGATVALFKSIRQNHPSQAEEWYLFVEPVLVRHGEYQLCMECIGNPQARFNVYCYTFKQLQALYLGMSERSEETKRKMEEFSRQPGGPPMSTYPHVNPGKMGLKNTRDNYVSEVRRLIEILVGTGHQEMAEKIRGEAVAVLNDPRLQSAVSDAEEKIQKRSTPAAASEGKQVKK